MAASVELSSNAFAENFWGENGFRVMRMRQKGDTTFYKDVTDLLNQWSKFELQHSKNMATLSKIGASRKVETGEKKGSALSNKVNKRTGSHANNMWVLLQGMLEERSAALKDFGEYIKNEVLEPLLKSEEAEAIAYRETTDVVKKVMATFVDLNETLRKNQQMYYECCRDLDKMTESMEKPKANLEKLGVKKVIIEEKVAAAKEAYEKSIVECKNYKRDYEKAITSALDDTQCRQEQRITIYRDSMIKLTKKDMAVNEVYYKQNPGLCTTAEHISPIKDLQEFVYQESTGSARIITDIEFEPYSIDKLAKYGKKKERKARAEDGETEVIMTGSVKKRAQGVIKKWDSRIAVLKGNTLFFHKKEGDAPASLVTLTSSTIVEVAEAKMKKPFCVEIRNGKTSFFFVAESTKEMNDWIAKLRQQASLASGKAAINADVDGSEGSDPDLTGNDNEADSDGEVNAAPKTNTGPSNPESAVADPLAKADEDCSTSNCDLDQGIVKGSEEPVEGEEFCANDKSSLDGAAPAEGEEAEKEVGILHTVIFDCIKSEESQLAAMAGDVVEVLDDDEDGSGWLYARKGEEEGYVPASFVKKADS